MWRFFPDPLFSFHYPVIFLFIRVVHLHVFSAFAFSSLSGCKFFISHLRSSFPHFCACILGQGPADLEPDLGTGKSSPCGIEAASSRASPSRPR